MKYGKVLKTSGIPHSHLVNYKKLKQFIRQIIVTGIDPDSTLRDKFKDLVLYELFELTDKPDITHQIVSLNSEAFRKILKKFDKLHLFEPLSQELLPIIYGRLYGMLECQDMKI